MIYHNFPTCLSSLLNRTKLILFVSLLIFGSKLYATNIHDFETTRMKGTGGAGVGALLIDEATFLNPAAMGFFKISSAYIQQTGMTISNQADATKVLDPPKSKNMGFVLSDASKKAKGSLSYAKQAEGFNERERFGISMAHPFSQKSAIGATYRITKDRVSENGFEYDTDNYNQFVFGATHSISNEVTMGLVVVDPMQVKPDETRGILGMQYEYKKLITLLFDIGSDYNKNLSEGLLYKGAFQVRTFKNFFLRVGMFNDRGKQEKGNGLGISWVQPKLMLDFAFKNTDVLESTTLPQEGQEIKETSFSISYRM
ncbi:MAG: hypothetical protein HN509_11625 [Halobacteriovoraceae bacterium]|jgi:hypothetical protein|nr:hypothetical protein [Halobacteriovoraceae bacterium]MBT5096013.1 hypothetical protein [Halobacteriovoraceae bacterium]